MKERNRFSIILEHLLTMANIKNYTLAKELQYDESYISKWRSGKLLPTEKNYDKILSGISRCIVDTLVEENESSFFMEYQVYNRSDLQKAIFDHLETEYNYVKDLKTSTGSEIASPITYYPEMPISQFITKMKHPSLRKVRELNVYAMMDILHLDTSYQLMIADFGNLSTDKNLKFPGVHFSMFIDYSDVERKAIYTAVFLMNMLTTLSSIDFNLYGGKQAKDKILFTVRDAFSISGMMIDKSHCISVTSCEDTEIVNNLNKQVRNLCTTDNLLIRKTSTTEMLENHEYEQAVFALNRRWLIGHPTEHILPDDLHEELLLQVFGDASPVVLDKFRQMHQLNNRILKKSNIRILIHESAYNNFAVMSTIDFYGKKVHLNSKQKLTYIKYLYELMQTDHHLDVKMVRGGVIDDLQHIPDPTLFLSDSFCYMSLETKTPEYNICIPNKVGINNIFRTFFDDLWDRTEYTLDENHPLSFARLLQHILQAIELMSDDE